jgi:uncharacterized glyoxalase superfamily protein PhnB
MTVPNISVQRPISILVYEDLEGAFEHLTQVFGLGPGELMRDGDGRVVHGEIQAGDGVIWLHLESRSSACPHPETWVAARRRSRSWSTTSTPTIAMPRPTAPTS